MIGHETGFLHYCTYLNETEQDRTYLAFRLFEVATGGQDNHAPEGNCRLDLAKEFVFRLIIFREMKLISIINEESGGQ